MRVSLKSYFLPRKQECSMNANVAAKELKKAALAKNKEAAEALDRALVNLRSMKGMSEFLGG